MASDAVELRWPGKYVDGERAPLADHGAQLRLRERLGTDPDNRVLCGDNLLALEALVREAPASVDLVYIDPPFATGNRFALARRVGDKKAGSEAQLRLPAFDDAWKGGVGGFLRMLDPRLRLIHQLLASKGSLYVHVDPTVGHAVKLMLDELFGPGCFQREIVWRIGWVSGFKTRARNWIRNHDSIFFYTKDPRVFVFNKMWVPHPKGYERREGRAAKAPGIAIDDVWNAGAGELELSGPASLDSIQIKSFSREKTGWATQKNESLLHRIISASSAPGAVVADLFAGSGTTAKVAASLGRRFVVCDHADAAVQITRNRLLGAKIEFEVYELDHGERDYQLERLAEEFGAEALARLRVWMLAQLQAAPAESAPKSPASGETSVFAGRRGSVALALAMPGERVDGEWIARVRAAGREQGFEAVELLGFDWCPSLDLASSPTATPSEGLPVIALQVGRGLFDAAARATAWVEGGVAVWERPELIVQVEPRDQDQDGDHECVRVCLLDIRLRRPEHLPEALRGRPFEEGLLGWSLANAETPSEPLFVAARSSTREALALEAVVARLPALVIAWEDQCGHRHQRRLDLDPLDPTLSDAR